MKLAMAAFLYAFHGQLKGLNMLNNAQPKIIPLTLHDAASVTLHHSEHCSSSLNSFHLLSEGEVAKIVKNFRMHLVI